MTKYIKNKLQASIQIVAQKQRNFKTKNKEGKKKILFFYVLPFTFYFLLNSLPTYAETINNACPPKLVFTAPSNRDFTFKDWDKTCGQPKNYIYSFEQMVLDLKPANIVYLGENHDNPKGHKKQLEIIQELYKRNPKIGIAMEMFQRPYQEVINQYLAGKLNEKELLEKSEYEKCWGFPWENYAPILKFAKEKRLPVIA